MSAHQRSRVPAGSVAGGQFSAMNKAAPGLTLVEDPWQEPVGHTADSDKPEWLWEDGRGQVRLTRGPGGLEPQMSYDYDVSAMLDEELQGAVAEHDGNLVHEFFVSEYGAVYGDHYDDEALILASDPMGDGPLTTEQITQALQGPAFAKLEADLYDADDTHNTTAARKLRHYIDRQLNPDAAPKPVQSPAELYDLVHRSLDDSAHHEAYFTERITPHLRGIDAADYEDDFFHPMARAIYRGDRDRAMGLAVRAYSLDEREARWKNDPNFTPPRIDSHDEHDMYGTRHVGSKYEPGRPLREIAKDVRADIKQAVAAGYLPNLDYRVRIDTRGTSAMRVEASGMADDDMYNAEHSHYSGALEPVRSQVATVTERRMEAIVGQYAHQQSNSQVDYWNNSMWIHTKVRSTTEAAAAKASQEEWDLQSKVHRASDPEQKRVLAAELVAARARKDQADQDVEQARQRIIRDASL